MFLKNKFSFICLQAVLFTALFWGCNLEKDIEVPLPGYESKLVVECYLEEGQPYRMSVTESVSYFEGPRLPNVNDADINIRYSDSTVRLRYQVEVDTSFRKAYNYTSTGTVQAAPGREYSLEVRDTKGRVVTGTARFLPTVPIKAVEWRYNKDSLAFLLIKFEDDPLTENFYRIQVHRDSLNQNADVDFNFDDSFKTGNEITIGTGYNFEKGEQLYVTLYHIEERFYNFMESVASAANANGNPFAQPAKVESTVQGGVGVFATLVYDRETIVIE